MHLEGAALAQAHFEGANLQCAQLEGRRLAANDEDLQRIQRWVKNFPATLPPADLRRAFFDRATVLEGATFGNADLGYVRVADARWGDVNLAVVNWGDAPILQDERAAQEWKPPAPQGTRKRLSRQERYEARQEQHEERCESYYVMDRSVHQRPWW